MRRSVILAVSARALTPVLLLVSLYVTFRGHNAPGGGFAGGLIMGAAVVLRYLSEGIDGVDRMRLDPVWLIAGGLAIALVTNTAPLLFGLDVMDSQVWDVPVPGIGDVHVVSAGFFDIGVHVLVVGVVIAILLTFVRADADAVALGFAASDDGAADDRAADDGDRTGRDGASDAGPVDERAGGDGEEVPT